MTYIKSFIQFFLKSKKVISSILGKNKPESFVVIINRKEKYKRGMSFMYRKEFGLDNDTANEISLS
jgi:hypothetical protein